MDISKIPIFQVLNRRLAWLTHRQQILAHNIANSNTPGYRPREAEPFAKVLTRVSQPPVLKVSDPRHVTVARTAAARFTEVKQKEVYGTTPNGNAVSFEEQLMKVGQNAMDYRLATNLFAKHLAMIKSVVGGSSR